MNLSLWKKPDRLAILNVKKNVLIPTQKIGGKTVERACTYTADFCYMQNGSYIVEDCKGMRTEVYKIKKKLMLYIHNIEIKET